MNQRLQTLGLDKAGERTASPQSCRDSHSLALTWRAVAFAGFARSTLSDTSRASLNFACRAKLTASTRRASSSSGLAETCSEVLSGLTPNERIPDCRSTRSYERASGHLVLQLFEVDCLQRKKITGRSPPVFRPPVGH